MSLRYKGAVLSTTSPTTSGSSALGLWTLGQQFQAQGGSGWPVQPPQPDPYFYDVALLVNGDGSSNGAQNNTFLDSSTNNFTITRNGNTTQGSFGPYGSLWSNYFNGSSSFSVPDNAGFDFGTGAFTVECWIYHTTASGVAMYMEHPTGGIGLYRDGSGYLSLAQANVANLATSSTKLPAYQWAHVAASRSGTSLKLFINGVQVASVSDSTNFTSSNAFNIGVGSGYYMTGYISNLRVVKGTALYTTGFTPPTSPLTAISGTSLLTCQSNRLKDNSSNNFTLTITGTPSVQRFSPFSPTASYSASTLGGSGYFPDGSYLTVPTNAGFSFGTGDFTIEAWVYYTGTNNSAIVGSSGSSFVYGVSGTLRFYTGNGANVFDATTAFISNQWVHVAAVRSGGILTLYQNGVAVGSTSYTVNINNGSNPYYVGTYYAGVGTYGWIGYLSNLRVVKGTAVYTGNFTPPTEPLTAIANTTLLCGFTNAGIPDAAMINDLETVGTAQVDTSVVKYGTGSLYFNGSSYLVGRDNNTLAFGTGDFTIEAWVYNTSAITTEEVVISLRGGGNSVWFGTKSGGFYTYPAGGTQGTVPKNTWTHLAMSRKSGVIYKFINGTQVYTGADTDNYDTYSPRIGGGDYYWTGYIDDVRVTNGYARYTTNFTPSGPNPTF